MTLESQVSDLVTSTTALTATVNNELAKVRAENANFQSNLATSFTSQSINATNGLSLQASGYRPFELINVSKKNDPSTNYSYTFYNMKGGENGGLSYNAFALYSYADDGIGGKLIRVPFTIQDNCAIRLGSYGPFLSGNSSAIGICLQSSSTYNNIVGIGNGAEVTGPNQIQLGGSIITTYAYGAVQNRSDLRDKTDIRPTVLGLTFIKSLRPVDFRWDLRDSYRKPMPQLINANASEQEKALYDAEMKKWLEESKLSNIVHDGSKKGKRYHHGIIAQELQELIRTTGVDFGGFQDHKIAGGDDVLSVGYPEFIAPLIKAVQELSDMNDALKERVKALESKVA